MATLYLIPTSLGDTAFDKILPAHNTVVVSAIKHFIVEDVRTARRFLKKTNPAINIDELTFYTLNQHTSPEAICDFLKPLHFGYDVVLPEDLAVGREAVDGVILRAHVDATVRIQEGRAAHAPRSGDAPAEGTIRADGVIVLVIGADDHGAVRKDSRGRSNVRAGFIAPSDAAARGQRD